MIALSNILIAIGVVLYYALSAMIFVTIARAVISWVNADPYNPIVRFLVAATEPFLRPLRKYIPLVGGGIDITPIVLTIVLFFLQIALAQTIIDYGQEIRKAGQGSERQIIPENATSEILPVL